MVEVLTPWVVRFFRFSRVNENASPVVEINWTVMFLQPLEQDGSAHPVCPGVFASHPITKKLFGLAGASRGKVQIGFRSSATKLCVTPSTVKVTAPKQIGWLVTVLASKVQRNSSQASCWLPG